jgi:hypothetical protein
VGVGEKGDWLAKALRRVPVPFLPDARGLRPGRVGAEGDALAKALRRVPVPFLPDARGLRPACVKRCGRNDTTPHPAEAELR